MAKDHIHIQGARQNNLKGLDLRLALNELVVVTGVSGSGKSSLAFDTVYAEGQRRYVETFSPYARQFLERMDRPRAERIEGIPPAIAIDQTNPVRTSRSTVGTMTELNDHLKLLYARAARLYCRGCAREVHRDTPQSICDTLAAEPSPRALLITFPVPVPDNFTEDEVRALLQRQGYDRIHARHDAVLEVVQGRVPSGRRAALAEALEAALRHGRGRVDAYPLDEARRPGPAWRFSSDLHCPHCDIHYRDPQPNLFSFNSPLGACETCRGFGRVMGIDPELVVPDPDKTLAQGAVRPWQSESYRECQEDLMRFAALRGVPTDRPWRALGPKQQRWVLEGEGDWDEGLWYGVGRFFDWLETKSYRMHIRVLLSRYRAYTRCPACRGARLKTEALLWRLGGRSDEVLAPEARLMPAGVDWSREELIGLPGLNLHELMRLPLARAQGWFRSLALPAPLDEATGLLLGEIRARLDYLVQVGLGYLDLDRQSRTLSGGEVQRINLTTALGTSLVNTLFVLDEPSIGLHARDMARVIQVLHRLRDAGNSLLVVEHDPQVMRAADRVLELGPGPGEHGGRKVFFGRPEALLRSPRSLTGRYLSGRKTVAAQRTARPPGARTRWLEILGAAEHNLKGIHVRIPLGRLVCVTGVSGSGKSTLVQDICYRALRKLKARPVEPPGRHRALRGHAHVGDVVLVDQSPIGKTSRSNPASYVGALGPIREAFAAQPLARERGYRAGTFSFNSGAGRCPACGGNGFEHVEMQFLSDVYLRCPACDGSRYRAEVLEVKLWPDGGGGPPRSMAQVLEMTVSEALALFETNAQVRQALAPLAAVGLEYLRLGQPVPTLSGGEAQRLKLAGHLAKAGKRRMGREGPSCGDLFLLDEPTTGLHFDDIARLIKALDALLAEGHSLVVIEHNLDLIRAADWVIDLGPEGGEAGGEIVCTGTPHQIAAHPASHTGAALRAEGAAAGPSLQVPAQIDRQGPREGDQGICIHHAREHNLKDIDLRIPRGRFTVITGVSGSGKSTVAFDILFNEGQRRYLESLNAYARQFVQPASRADVDAVYGIPPTVAIEQRSARGGPKSTVATVTEIHHFLRLLFARLGTQYCPDCELPIRPQSPETIVAQVLGAYRGREILVLAPLVSARKGYYSELAQWAAARGHAWLRVDGEPVPTEPWPRLARYREHHIELPLGELVAGTANESELYGLLQEALEHGRGVVHIVPREGDGEGSVYSTRRACPGCGRGFEDLDPRSFSFNSPHGWCETCQGTGLAPDATPKKAPEAPAEGSLDGDRRPCPACGGRRLRAEALAVRFQGRSIAELTALPVARARRIVQGLALAGREARIARDVLAELRARLRFLEQVGLGYLGLDRAAPSLSGGEAQRMRLAAQLGSQLRGVCYILDEPTIGLHPRDNQMLLKTLHRLGRQGNTVVVVEHDEATIRHAEHVVDLGPGAGVQGGRVVAEGPPQALMAHPDSLTGRMLASPLRHPLRGRRPVPAEAALEIVGPALHNLRMDRVVIPLGRLVCVTGVSGSGKSTLVRGVLKADLARVLGAPRSRRGALQRCQAVTGGEAIGRLLEVDQAPIGKTPRSCPATYVGLWDGIRRLFAATPEARLRGYGPGRFSFNVRGGRCEACEGQGMKRIEMNFLPDVRLPCEVCGGARFNEETLSVRYRGKSIADVLAMGVDEAAAFLSAHRALRHTLALMAEVGLGYLTLGQQSPTLSGGEAQRIKLVAELARLAPAVPRPGAKPCRPALYILDEPTIGLHMADVERLIGVLHRLVETGATVIVIEHNLDVIAEADWIIDLGPEGGEGGGRIVAQGTPEAVARIRRGSHTARFLRRML